MPWDVDTLKIPADAAFDTRKRVRSVSLARLCRKHTERATAVLLEIMEDKDAPPASRVTAAKEILDRGHGKAPMTITVEEDGDSSQAAFRAILERAAMTAYSSHPTCITIDAEPVEFDPFA